MNSAIDQHSYHYTPVDQNNHIVLRSRDLVLLRRHRAYLEKPTAQHRTEAPLLWSNRTRNYYTDTIWH